MTRMEIHQRRLSVALVAPPYYQIPPSAYGGIEAVVADLANALVREGHTVYLVGAGTPGTDAEFVRTWDHLVPEQLGTAYPEVMNELLTRRAIAGLVGKIDVVHDHSVSGPLNADIYARWGLPTVVTMHGPADDQAWRAYYGGLGPSVHMVAISQRQRILAPELNWAGTVHNAVHVDEWPFLNRKGGYALFLGRYSQDKGAHTALDVAHQAGIPLILAGKCSEPSEKRYFAEQVEPRLGPHDVVFGLADAQEKRRLLANAQCLLFPVEWEEPFGMVMIEAMACGTPVVALSAGSVPEVVVDGVTGFVCRTHDDLVPAIEAAKRIDPVACRAHVASRFNTTILARGYVAAYQRALAAMPRPRSVARIRPSRLPRRVAS
jgi:glycosyltransferase involved in cell wall biosynthesis